MTTPGFGPARNRCGLLRLSSVRIGMRQLRQAEIEDLDEAVAGDHHVLGFYVPVNDARGMSLGEPVGHLSGNREQLAQRKRTGIEQLPQRLSIHQLHDDERGGIALPDLVDGHDIGMVQGGGQTRLRLKALQASRVRRQLGRQDLDRHLALKPRVPGPVDLPIPPAPSGLSISYGPSRVRGEIVMGSAEKSCRRTASYPGAPTDRARRRELAGRTGGADQDRTGPLARERDPARSISGGAGWRPPEPPGGRRFDPERA